MAKFAALILVNVPWSRALPHVMTCQKFSGETKAKQEGGVILKKGKALPPKTGKTKANRERGIMENEMPSLLLDEKYAF